VYKFILHRLVLHIHCILNCTLKVGAIQIVQVGLCLCLIEKEKPANAFVHTQCQGSVVAHDSLQNSYKGTLQLNPSAFLFHQTS
jgi:hypothetical protein